jgi:hypothetical protein
MVNALESPHQGGRLLTVVFFRTQNSKFYVSLPPGRILNLEEIQDALGCCVMDIPSLAHYTPEGNKMSVQKRHKTTELLKQGDQVC